MQTLQTSTRHIPRHIPKLRPSPLYLSRPVSVLLFGRPTDWRGEEKTFALWPTIKRHGGERLFLPDPAHCNATVARPEMFAAHEAAPFPFFTAYAEGAVLEKEGDACILKSADCPTIVARNAEGRTVVGHGALNALVDRKVVHEGPGEKRFPGNVVDSIVECFEKEDIADLSVFVTLGIGPQHFVNPFTHPDPAYRLKNRELVKFLEYAHPECIVGDREDGRIDLFLLIADLCVKAGVERGNIVRDSHDTYSDTEESGSCWWSNRRDGPGQGRNAVVVIR